MSQKPQKTPLEDSRACAARFFLRYAAEKRLEHVNLTYWLPAFLRRFPEYKSSYLTPGVLKKTISKITQGDFSFSGKCVILNKHT